MLPTNRDENWRYANLRPLAKARVDAAVPDAELARPHRPARSASGLRTLGVRRWPVRRRICRTPAADTCATLLERTRRRRSSSRQCSTRPSRPRAPTSRWRVSTARAATQVLQIAPPDGAAPEHRTDVRGNRRGRQRHFVSTRAGACRPQFAVAHRRAASERRQRRTPLSMPPSISRCARMRASITAACRTSATPRAASTR